MYCDALTLRDFVILWLLDILKILRQQIIFLFFKISSTDITFRFNFHSLYFMFYLFLKRRHKEGFQQMFSPKKIFTSDTSLSKTFSAYRDISIMASKICEGILWRKKIKVGDFNLFSIIDFTSAMRIDEKKCLTRCRKGLKTNVSIFS